MIWLLGALVAFLCSTLVAITVGVFIAAGHDAERRDAREKHLILCLAARRVSEVPGAAAEVRALHLLDQDARATAKPDDWSAIVERLVDGPRGAKDPFKDPVTGEDATPVGMT